MKKMKYLAIALLAALPLAGCDGFHSFRKFEPIEQFLASSETEPKATDAEDHAVTTTETTVPSKPQPVYKVKDNHIVLLDYEPTPDFEELLLLPDEIEEMPVTEIGEYGFSSTNYFEHIRLPESLVEIGDYGFKGSGLTALHLIGGEPLSVGEYCFKDCRKLGAVTLSDIDISFDEYCFDNSAVTNFVTDCTLKLEAYCFRDMPSLEIVDISGKADIGEYCFTNCPMLSSVLISNAELKIDDYAFCDCAMESLDIDGCTGTIGEYTFSDCFRLESAMIGEGITELGAYSFRHCGALEMVMLPASLTKIGDNCFVECGDVMIIAPAGSYAEQYANEHGLRFSAL